MLQALVIAPSRELAMQIVRVGQSLLPVEARGCIQQAIGGANPVRQVGFSMQEHIGADNSEGSALWMSYADALPDPSNSKVVVFDLLSTRLLLLPCCRACAARLAAG